MPCRPQKGLESARETRSNRPSAKACSANRCACRHPTCRRSRRCSAPCSPTTRRTTGVSEFLAPEHFADPLHGRIFLAITRRVEAGQLADAITLRAEFEHSGLLDEVGGVAYLGQLLTAMVGIINAGEYGRAIHDAWLRRQLIDIGENVVNNAFGQTPELDGAKQIEAGEEALFRLATEKGQGGWSHHLRAGADGCNRHCRESVPPPGRRGGAHHRAARPRQEDRRPASVRPADPGRASRRWARRRWRPRSPSARRGR